MRSIYFYGRECEIDDDHDWFPLRTDVDIHADEGAKAQEYAKDHGQKFVSPDEELKEYKKGDVDLNGDVTAADARLALRAAVQLETLEPLPHWLADADNNDAITAADARLILRAAVGLEVLR